jgi:hypothetical protein
VIRPTPLLDFFKRGEVAPDAKRLAADGGLATCAYEQLAILVELVGDGDAEIRAAAERTLGRIPIDPLRSFLARPDVPPALRDFFAARGVAPGDAPSEEHDEPLIDPEPPAPVPEPEDRETAVQKIAKMGFTERLKAAVKGSREMRSILIRDPNKMICAAVLSSPKVSQPEIESFARMANVSEEVIRIIAANRVWTKNYGVIVGLTKNPKTPLAMSLNFLARLTDRDLQQVSVDRNIPEPLRIAARKRVVSNASGKG